MSTQGTSRDFHAEVRVKERDAFPVALCTLLRKYEDNDLPLKDTVFVAYHLITSVGIHQLLDHHIEL